MYRSPGSVLTSCLHDRALDTTNPVSAKRLRLTCTAPLEALTLIIYNLKTELTNVL